MSDLHARRAGVCLHITALPGRGGIGTLGESAYWFVDQLCASGMTLWQILPTGPTGYGDSPYQLLSVFAGNPMMIDLPRLAERGLLTADELGTVPDGDPDSVDFGALVAPRRALLARAAARFGQVADPATLRRYAVFCARHGAAWLDDYAEFSAIKRSAEGRPWYDWPAPLAQAQPEALASLRQRCAEQLEHTRIVQFLFHEQWAELAAYARRRGVKLIGDLPIYVAHDSADTWSRRDLLQFDAAGQLAAVGGVPPDYFSADGQLWGNPLYDWDAHARDGFAWWRNRLAHACSLNDFVRIDHFRGFEAFWSVAATARTAREGEWIRGPNDALFDALLAHRPDLPIIAEDLGLITPPVEALRKKYNLPGMAVLQFMVMEDDFTPENIEEDRVCYTGTHDNDTTRGWFDDGDTPADHARRERVLAVTGGRGDRVARDLFGIALDSRARFAIAPMQDLLELPGYARFNTPGTTNNNWRWRLRREDFDADLCSRLAAAVRASDRLPDN